MNQQALETEKDLVNTHETIDSHRGADLRIYKLDRKLDAKYFTVSVRPDGIEISPQDLTTIEIGDIPVTIKFEDFIGIEISRNAIDKDRKRILFHTTLFNTIICGGADKSRRVMKSFEFFGDSLGGMKEWRHRTMGLWWNWTREMYGAGISEEENMRETTGPLMAYEKKILVIINPKGGQGSAVQEFERVKRYLQANGMHLTVIHTKHRPHAMEIIRDMPAEDFNSFYAVISVGGDGIAHEIVNGYYQRLDFKEVKLRLGFLLGGSACGLAASACLGWGLTKTQDNLVWVMTRGRFSSGAITKYITDGDVKVIYGLGCFFHGFLSDVDFKSEKWRWMGESRFKIYSYLKMLNLDKRPCKYWVSERPFPERENVENWMPDFDESLEGEDWKFFEGKFYGFFYQTSVVLSETQAFSNRVRHDSDFGDTWIAPTKNGYFNFAKGLLMADENKNGIVESKKHITEVTRAFRLELLGGTKHNAANSLLDIDGEPYLGSKVQGMVIKDRLPVLG